MNKIPPTLAPFFQEYSLESLDAERSAATIIERTLQYGDREEVRWLFTCYPHQQIRDWVKRWGALALQMGHRKSFDLDFFSPTEDIPTIREVLMEAAPRKYPHARDFEAMVARRLAYFERADEEEPVPLIQPASWERVKDFIELQALLIGRSWIE